MMTPIFESQDYTDYYFIGVICLEIGVINI